MPDITMCDNQKCNRRTKCYRAKAEPSYMQSWSIFNNDSVLGDKCEYFVEIIRHEERELSSYCEF